jgi:hypothetical protein
MKLVRILLYGQDDVYVDRLVNEEMYYYLLDLEKSFEQNKPYAPQFLVIVLNDFYEDL